MRVQSTSSIAGKTLGGNGECDGVGWLAALPVFRMGRAVGWLGDQKKVPMISRRNECRNR